MIFIMLCFCLIKSLYICICTFFIIVKCEIDNKVYILFDIITRLYVKQFYTDNRILLLLLFLTKHNIHLYVHQYIINKYNILHV